jgi:uncharacterized protein
VKFLLLFFIFMVLLWKWRHGRSTQQRAPHTHAKAVKNPIAMVRCARCGVHLPEKDATPGKQGLYCSAQHRQHSEAAT